MYTSDHTSNADLSLEVTPPHVGNQDLLEQLRSRYVKHGHEDSWRNEKDNWEKILEALQSDPGGIAFNYELESVIDIGGAGAVFRVIDKNLYAVFDSDDPTTDDERRRRSFRALKTPRPHSRMSNALANSLRSEVSKLSSLSHPNIVSLYAKGQVIVPHSAGSLAWPWYIMEYLHDATDLQNLCKSAPPKPPQLIHYLHDVATGLEYVHRSGHVHCDVKPGNVFVSATSRSSDTRSAVLGDFGYAKRMEHADSLTTIGFTEKFAHPDLKHGAEPSSDDSRNINRLPRCKIRPAFDLFALGMSLDYLLKEFYSSHDVYEQYGYELKYLKLCIARLLDGRNDEIGITFGGLPPYCFVHTNSTEGISYRSISEFRHDLSKVMGVYSLEHEVPELVETRRENIQVSDSAPVVFTERLRKVVNHPLVRRLAGTTQLGLVSTLYPGATHSRLEHSLGTFGVTARYLQALYNDSTNPMFRQLVDATHVKATLLAALLHDIGQYPLGHDLEDVSSDFFGHTGIGEKALSTQVEEHAMEPLFKEVVPERITLAQTLDEVLRCEWSVSLDDVLGILKAHSSERSRTGQTGSYAQRLCDSLIDGPIDADKVDYLRRDSRHCGVKYGYGIDDERLFKCLTVASHSIEANHLLLVMGVTRKGRIPAESILFTRYAMFTQVYWHHTMRAIKALLHFAASEILAANAGENLKNLRDGFFNCAVLGKPCNDKDWLARTSGAHGVDSISSGDLRVLEWIWHHTSRNGRAAVERILTRDFMKRVLAIHRSDLGDAQKRILDRVFAEGNFRERLQLRRGIENAIKARLQQKTCSDDIVETYGFTHEEWLSRLEHERGLSCVVDFPSQRRGASFGLQIVDEWRGHPGIENLEQSPMTHRDEMQQVIPLTHFSDGMRQLEKSIAYFRLFWDHQETPVLSRLLTEEEIREAVVSVIEGFAPE